MQITDKKRNFVKARETLHRVSAAIIKQRREEVLAEVSLERKKAEFGNRDIMSTLREALALDCWDEAEG